jgi:hypothetical protein
MNMTGNDYLFDLLASQELEEGCEELIALDTDRENVDCLIKEAYPNSNPTFTHGGSRAKGTMIREDYDLDEVCYFDNDDTEPGETLEDIYENIAKLLAASYSVRRKCSALRLSTSKGKDVRIDVIPGRYTDATRTDVFIHQNDGDKDRLKTNLEKHISYVRFSGCTDVIKLTKLWRTRNVIGIKTFPLELLVIGVLSEDGSGDLETRFRRVLTAFADDIDNLFIEDPANPTGNDLSEALTDAICKELSKIARNTLAAVDKHGWEHVFGKVEAWNAAPRVQILRAAAATVAVPTRPWASAD